MLTGCLLKTFSETIMSFNPFSRLNSPMKTQIPRGVRYNIADVRISSVHPKARLHVKAFISHMKKLGYRAHLTNDSYSIDPLTGGSQHECEFSFIQIIGLMANHFNSYSYYNKFYEIQIRKISCG